MPQQTFPSARTRACARTGRGFSFTEVLFAVMILGIGFIMVAAIFPVAIQQSKTSTEETTGAAVARGGANYLEKIASNSTMPATGNLVVAADYDPDGDTNTIATAIGGSLVIPADGRIAWVPFYRRAGEPGPVTGAAGWASYAQVFMIPVQTRSQSQYQNVNGIDTPTVVEYVRGGKLHGTALIRIDLTNGTGGAADRVTFKNAVQATVASEGAYVIIADARQSGNIPWNLRVAPNLNGRIYRLGNPLPPASSGAVSTQWELMPGFDFEPLWFDMDGDPSTPAGGRDHDNDPSTPNVHDGREKEVTGLTDVAVFVVGKGAIGGPGGTAQDVAAYTTFVNVN